VTTPALYLIVPLAPLAAAIIVGLFGPKLGRWISHSLCIAGVALSTIASYFVWRDIGGHTFNGDVYVWRNRADSSLRSAS
jgi:NADH-quinone oxidoreductase subunit L